MRQLTILSGAGINHSIASECQNADDLINFTYQKVSSSVYERIPPNIQAMFSVESFDYILGGLMTINLAIERTKEELRRFAFDQAVFAQLFRQTELQNCIIAALEEIEEKLTVSLAQMIGVIQHFDTSINHLTNSYDSINYYTVNFDGVFDHIIYGERYSRGWQTTDFWFPSGDLNKEINRRIKIMHLHGDLRYKPFKKTSRNNPPYRWPVLVVGDEEVKKGIIGGYEALRFYNNRLTKTCESRDEFTENNLVIIGFGFRQEDKHIVAKIEQGIINGIFDKIIIFDYEDKLADCPRPYFWAKPQDFSLSAFLQTL